MKVPACRRYRFMTKRAVRGPQEVGRNRQVFDVSEPSCALARFVPCTRSSRTRGRWLAAFPDIRRKPRLRRGSYVFTGHLTMAELCAIILVQDNTQLSPAYYCVQNLGQECSGFSRFTGLHNGEGITTARRSRRHSDADRRSTRLGNWTQRDVRIARFRQAAVDPRDSPPHHRDEAGARSIPGSRGEYVDCRDPVGDTSLGYLRKIGDKKFRIVYDVISIDGKRRQKTETLFGVTKKPALRFSRSAKLASWPVSARRTPT